MRSPPWSGSVWSNLWNVGVGLKVTMAASGAGLVLFVVLHVVGNLLVLLGPETFNSYSATLKGNSGFLWTLRLLVATGVLVHVFTAARLKARNRAARPQPYARWRTGVGGNPASRFMMSTGLLLLVFLVFHLQHFTVGSVQPEQFHLLDAQGRHDAYAMLVLGLSQPAFAALYVLASVLVAVHLSHAVTSMAASLGLDHPWWRAAGPAVAAVVGLGNVGIVMAVQVGWVLLP